MPTELNRFRLRVDITGAMLALVMTSPLHALEPPATPWQRLCRAGQPHTVAKWARCSNSPSYSGNYVGGGAAWHGEPRRCDEGTWGWDYAPRHVWSPKVDLGWWHGRRTQGGTGSYRTDGVKLTSEKP
jgi:hypothetical protein